MIVDDAKKISNCGFQTLFYERYFFFHSTYFVVVPDFNFFILRFFARAYFDKYTEEEEGLVTQ